MGLLTDLEPGEGLILPDGRLVRRDALGDTFTVYGPADDDSAGDDPLVSGPPVLP